MAVVSPCQSKVYLFAPREPATNSKRTQWMTRLRMIANKSLAALRTLEGQAQIRVAVLLLLLPDGVLPRHRAQRGTLPRTRRVHVQLPQNIVHKLPPLTQGHVAQVGPFNGAHLNKSVACLFFSARQPPAENFLRPLVGRSTCQTPSRARIFCRWAPPSVTIEHAPP